ncbi:hypothetical protein [Methanosphaerula subterraneus]|uniref:hypothetical protein n=1 Tax=Methanosphaerula subterraneus TaxID=3350244 RepID=UPI003F862D7E
MNRSTRNPGSGILRCHTVGPLATRRSPKVFDLKTCREMAINGVHADIGERP